MNEISTPRTDAAQQFVYGHIDKYWIDPYFARQLERELAAATKERDAWKQRAGVLKTFVDVATEYDCKDAASLRRVLNVGAQEIDRLTSELHEVREACGSAVMAEQRLADSEKARQEAEAKLTETETERLRLFEDQQITERHFAAERVAHEETKKECERLMKQNGAQQHYYSEWKQAIAERDSLRAQLAEAQADTRRLEEQTQSLRSGIAVLKTGNYIKHYARCQISTGFGASICNCGLTEALEAIDAALAQKGEQK